MGFAGGTGGPNDPFQIATAEQLCSIGSDPNLLDKHFVLVADIDLDPNLPGGKVFDRAVIAPDTDDDYDFQGTKFSGKFDGKEHVIRNLQIQGKDYLGLFGAIGREGAVTNVGLENADINGIDEYGDLVGALAGINRGYITLSYSTGTVRGHESVGGLVGSNLGMIISNYSTSMVNGIKTSFLHQSAHIGGLVGVNSGNIIASYSHGDVERGSYVGGLIGENWGSIAACYSTGRVSGDYAVGGLVGGPPGYVVASFWDIYASGQYSSAAGTGLTTAQMKNIRTFLNAGWDFVDETANGTCQFWRMQVGHYPELSVSSGVIHAEPIGLGTLEYPYCITDANELGTLWYRPWANYRLEVDIDLAGITWSAAVVPWFAGSLDGHGHVIRNLRIQGAGYMGLFGILASAVSLMDVTLEDVDVHGTGKYIGGLAGHNYGCVTLSSSKGMIGGDQAVGGLIGYNQGKITSCHSTGEVNGQRDPVGGLVSVNFGHIFASYSTNTVSGNDYVGGLVGLNGSGDSTSITSCYSKGTVSGDRCVGGMVALNYGNIASCYSIGAVKGNYEVGGLVAASSEESIISSFWDVETSGLTVSAGGTRLHTAKMQDINTYRDAGWDFVNIWCIQANDYPRLKWEAVCP